MRVAHTASEGNGVALDDGSTIVERSVVVAIVAESVADLLLLRSVACEVGEEIGYFWLCVLSMGWQSERGCQEGCENELMFHVSMGVSFLES
jgi:hypothetical protein